MIRGLKSLESSMCLQLLPQRTFGFIQRYDNAGFNFRNVVPSWISGATSFSAKIDAAKDEAVVSLQVPFQSTIAPELLSNLETHGIDHWFPVQKAVLPILLSDHEGLVMPPRDAVSSLNFVG